MSKKDEWKYDIEEILGIASPDVDLKSSWCKAVLKTLLNDNEEGIDIRRFNKDTHVMGNGIRLKAQEAHNLVDILVSKGYGSTSVLDEELKRRKLILGDCDDTTE